MDAGWFGVPYCGCGCVPGNWVGMLGDWLCMFLNCSYTGCWVVGRGCLVYGRGCWVEVVMAQEMYPGRLPAGVALATL